VEPNQGSSEKAAVFAVVFVGMVAISSFHCGDEEINEANIGPKVAAALCDAENTCCTSQGYPQSGDRRMLCELTAQAGLFHPDGYVFNADIAAQCLKAAQAYQCRDRNTIDNLCRRVYSDPAVPSTPTIYGPEGAACGGFGGTCAFYDGLTCIIEDPVAGTGTCRKWSMTGGVCRYYTDCVVGDYCDSTMTCMPTLPDGAPCTSTSECKSTNCMNGVCMSRGACSLV
jgi:hypothetical protein